jgi:ATP-dependent RNA helicase DHX37/DHR1
MVSDGNSLCRYVVDAGRAKVKRLDSATSAHRFPVQWVSQASADQRGGRAGRTGPGHCYRLYSSAVFKDLFPDFMPPEILNTALDGVVLSMHAMGLPKVRPK